MKQLLFNGPRHRRRQRKSAAELQAESFRHLAIRGRLFSLYRLYDQAVELGLWRRAIELRGQAVDLMHDLDLPAKAIEQFRTQDKLEARLAKDPDGRIAAQLLED